MSGLDGRVAIVTGASSGAGRAYALALSGAGATVVAAARRLGDPAGPPQRNTLDELVRTGAERDAAGPVFACRCDLSKEEEIIRLVSETVANHGRVDVLVNNAAILTNYDTFDIPGDDWEAIMNVNVRAAYLTIRETVPHMMRQRSGSIINITSAGANLTPHANFARTLAYGVSKAALNKLTYFVAAEVAEYGIAVNALSPGLVASDNALAAAAGLTMSGPFKPATPEVLGPPLLHLAGQGATGMTGQIVMGDQFGEAWGPSVNRD